MPDIDFGTLLEEGLPDFGSLVEGDMPSFMGGYEPQFQPSAGPIFTSPTMPRTTVPSFQSLFTTPAAPAPVLQTQAPTLPPPAGPMPTRTQAIGAAINEPVTGGFAGGLPRPTPEQVKSFGMQALGPMFGMEGPTPTEPSQGLAAVPEKMIAGGIAGAEDVLEGLADWFSTPSSIAQLFMAGVPIVQVPVLLNWAAQMLASGAVSATELRQNLKDKDWYNLTRNLVGGLTLITGGAAVGTKATLGAIATKRGIQQIRRPTYASQEQAAAAVHGTVRAPSGEGPGQVPAQGGGAGVRAPAQAVAQTDQVLLNRLENLARKIISGPGLDETDVRFVNDLVRRDPEAHNQLVARVEELRRQRAETLTTEEQGYLDKERTGIDAPIEVVGPGEQGDMPFAQGRGVPGMFMGANPETGAIEIYPEGFSRWLQSLPEKMRSKAVRARLIEEFIHLKTPAESALRYWRSLTQVEQAIESKLYTGRWTVREARPGEMGLTEGMLAKEAIRRRIQRLSGDSSEAAESALMGRWSVQSLEALGDGIRGLREFFGDQAKYAEQRKYLDHILRNISAAQQAIKERGGEKALAIDRRYESEAEARPDVVSWQPGDFAPVRFVRVQHGWPSMGWYEATRPFLSTDGGVYYPHKEGKALISSSQILRTGMRIPEEELKKFTDAGGVIKAPTPTPREEPAGAIQRRGKGRYGPYDPDQLKMFEQLGPMNWLGAVEPTGPKPSAEEMGALPRLNAMDIQKAAENILASPITAKAPPVSKTGPQTEIGWAGLTEAKALPPVEYERPGFKDFADWAQRNVPGIEPSQLRSVWEDAVTKAVLNAPSERLMEWRRALGLESAYGKGEIPPPLQLKTKALPKELAGLDPEARSLRKELIKQAEAGQRYRTKVTNAIMRRLLEETLERNEPRELETVTLDDIGFSNRNSEYPAYYEFKKEEAGDLEKITKVLRDQARRSSDDPVSWTRRLLVAQNLSTGEVEILSSFSDAGTQRVTDPLGAGIKQRPSRILDANFLRQYRPIASILLEEPVQHFREQYKRRTQYESSLGVDARKQSEVADYDVPAEPVLKKGERRVEDVWGEDVAKALVEQQLANIEMAEGGAASRVERGAGGSVVGPEAGAARAQMGMGRGEHAASRRTHLQEPEVLAVINHIMRVSEELETPEHVQAALADFAAKPSPILMSAWGKIARAAQKKYPELSNTELWNRIIHQIHENWQNTQGREGFVRLTMEQVNPAPVKAAGIGARAPGEGGAAAQAPEELISPERKPIRRGSKLFQFPQGGAPEPAYLPASMQLQLEAGLRGKHPTIPRQYEKIVQPFQTKGKPTGRILRTSQPEFVVMPKPSLLTLGTKARPKYYGPRTLTIHEKASPIPKAAQQGEMAFAMRRSRSTAERLTDLFKDVNAFIRTGAETVPVSVKNLDDRLYQIETRSRADYVRAMPLVDQALRTLSEKDRETLFNYVDQMQVIRSTDIELNATQKDLYNRLIAPLVEQNQRMFNALRNEGVAVPESTYYARIAKDPNNIFERIVRNVRRGITEGTLLSKSASFLKRRVMKAITDGESRRVVAIVGEGKNGRLLAFDKGKVEDLGEFSYGEMPHLGDLAEEELKPLRKRSSEIRAERDVLMRTPEIAAAAEKRIDRLNEMLADVGIKITNVQARYPDALRGDRVWIDKRGKRWHLTDATTAEIEANTNTRYYKDPFSTLVSQNLKLRELMRAMQFFDDLQKSPEFGLIARHRGERNIPEGWRRTKIDQLAGFVFEPHVADVLDRFAQRHEGGALTFRALTATNAFLRTSIFYNPALHVPNLLDHWKTFRGTLAWINPKAYARMLDTGVRAVEAVVTKNRDYIHALDEGAPMLNVRADQMVQAFQELLQNQALSKRGPMARLGAKVARFNPLQAIYRLSSAVTWGANDILTLQAIYEVQKATGMSMPEAIHEVGKHIPNYRVPARVMDVGKNLPRPWSDYSAHWSRLASAVMTNPNLTMFGAYHYGALKSYGEMFKEVAGKESTWAQRAKGLDRMASIALFLMVGYPLIDWLIGQVTRDKKLQMRRAGSATVPENLIRLAQGTRSGSDVVQSIMTPAVGTKALVELIANRDLYTGRRIYTRQGGVPQAARQVGSWGVGKIAPVGQMQALQSGIRTPAQFGLSFVGVTKKPRPEVIAATRRRDLEDILYTEARRKPLYDREQFIWEQMRKYKLGEQDMVRIWDALRRRGLVTYE